MAIKISGTTIVNDSRVVENADKIGIGRTTPRYDLEILSDAVPTGIAVSVTSTQATETNKGLTIFNNGQSPTFTVSYKGRVDAEEYYGTFKGTIDTGVSIENANNVQITDDTTGSGTHYVHFGSATSGYDGVEVDSTDLVYKDRKFGIGTNGPDAYLHVKGTGGGAGNDNYLKIEGTSTGALGPNLVMQHTSSSPADDDVISRINFNGLDDADHTTTYSQIKAVATDVSNNSEKGDLIFGTRNGSDFSERLRITSDGVINCGHGSAINLHGSTTTGINLNGNGNSGQIVANASGNRALIIGRQSDYGQVIEFFQGTNTNEAAITIPAADSFGIETAGEERLRIDSSGNVNIGVNSSSNPFTYLRFGASLYGAVDIRPTDEASHKVGIAFYTDGTQDTLNPIERLRINSSGHLEPKLTDTYDIGTSASKRFRTVYAQII